MSLTLSFTESESNYKIVEAGNHVARCVQVVDLGTQEITDPKTGKINNVHKIRLTWELPFETIEWTDKETQETKTAPQLISREFTASLYEQAMLRKILKSWRGRDFTPEELAGFNLNKLLGAVGTVNVIHQQVGDKIYPNVAAVTPLTKGTSCPDQITPSIYFDLDEFDQNIFNLLPKFLQEKINKSLERRSEIDLPLVNDDGTDYVPNQAVDTSNLPDPKATANELPEIDMDEINTPF